MGGKHKNKRIKEHRKPSSGVPVRLSAGSVLSLAAAGLLLVCFSLFFVSFYQPSRPVPVSAPAVPPAFSSSEPHEVPPTLPPFTAVMQEKPSGTAKTVTVNISGLTMPQKTTAASVFNAAASSYNFTSMFASLSPYLTGNLNISLLNTVPAALKGSYSNADKVCPESLLNTLKNTGFNYVLLNSGGILEMGDSAAADAINRILKSDLHCSGLQTEPISPKVFLDIDGIRIAILSYTDPATLSKTAAASNLYIPFDPGIACSDISYAKEYGADFVFVSVRWGKASQTSVSDNQRASAQRMAAAGADAILGCGPTRMLPAEKITENGHNCYVLYSLGTLISDSRDGYDIAGGIFSFTLRKTDTVAYISACSCLPTYVWKHQESGGTRYIITPSNQSAPADMENDQKGFMANALGRIVKALNGVIPLTE